MPDAPREGNGGAGPGEAGDVLASTEGEDEEEEAEELPAPETPLVGGGKKVGFSGLVLSFTSDLGGGGGGAGCPLYGSQFVFFIGTLVFRSLRP